MIYKNEAFSVNELAEGTQDSTMDEVESNINLKDLKTIDLISPGLLSNYKQRQSKQFSSLIKIMRKVYNNPMYTVLYICAQVYSMKQHGTRNGAFRFFKDLYSYTYMYIIPYNTKTLML